MLARAIGNAAAAADLMLINNSVDIISHLKRGRTE
jgi:hypothetical protein